MSVNLTPEQLAELRAIMADHDAQAELQRQADSARRVAITNSTSSQQSPPAAPAARPYEIVHGDELDRQGAAMFAPERGNFGPGPSLELFGPEQPLTGSSLDAIAARIFSR